MTSTLQPLADSPCVLYLAATRCETLRFTVTSLAQAAQAFIAYRELYNLGASQLKRNCGAIYGQDGKTIVARISYNGRAWSADGKTMLEDSPCLAHFSAQPCPLCLLESEQ